MISDLEAKELTDGFDALPDDFKPRARAVLTDYLNAKERAGQKPFEQPAEEKRQGRERWEALYAGLDGIEQALPKEKQARFKELAGVSVDGQETKARMVNQSWVAENYPQVLTPAFESHWPVLRRQLAKELFAVDKPEVAEAEFYGLVAKKLTDEKAEREMLGDVFVKMQLEAAKGDGDWLGAWKKSAATLSSNPAWQPGRQDSYRQAAQAVYRQALDELAPLRPAIELGRAYYAAMTQAPKPAEGGKGRSFEEQQALAEGQREAREAFIGMLRTLPKEQQELALSFAIAAAAEESAKPMGEEGEAGFADKAAAKLERSMSGTVERLASFTKQAAAQISPFRAYLQGDELERRVEQGLVDAVDPIKSKSRLVQGVYDAIDSLPYMAMTMVPTAGILLAMAAMAEDNRRKFVDNGVPEREALALAMLAAAPQVGIERVQATMVFKGRLPGFERWLNKPVTSKVELARKMAGVGGIELVQQNAEEAMQDALPAVTQELASMLTEAVPGVDWSKEWADFSGGRVDTFFAMLPLVLVGTGAASFKEAAYGRKYLEDRRILTAAGIGEAKVEEILAAKTLAEKEGLVKEAFDERRKLAEAETAGAAADVAADAEANARQQREAFAELDAEMQASYQEAVGDYGAKAVLQEDGSYAVLDSAGELVDVAASPEAAKQLVTEIDQAETVTAEQSIQDMMDFLANTAEEGQTIERVRERRMLSDKVEAGEITREEAERAVQVAVGLGTLEAGTTLEQVRIQGENQERFNARTRVFEDVSRIYEGADPLVVVEERAEGYIKRRLAQGEATAEDLQRWREQMDGPQADNSKRALVEWFSKQAQAYMVGQAEAEGVPSSFRAFLRRMRQYFEAVLRMAVRLKELDQAGKLEGDFKMHLARATGLDATWLEQRERAKEREAALDRGAELGEWVKGRLQHPDTAKAEGEPLAGELRDLFDGMRNRQAAQAFFAKRGEGVPLDRLTEQAREAGFGFETPAELLAGLDDSLRGIPVYGEPVEATFALAPAVESEAFKKWFGDSKVVDAEGKPLVVYHGARRADRIGNRINPKRATSGPMPFFTADPEIASGYATGKNDTSLDRPDDYAGWFKFKGKGMRVGVPIDRAWWFLTQEQRQQITDRIYTVGYENADVGEGAIIANSQSIQSREGIEWELRQARGNALRALVEIWLNSASLFGDEAAFMDVLKAAGMDLATVEFDPPNQVRSGIFPVFLSIRNPLDTEAVPKSVVAALEQAGKRKRAKAPAGGDPDPWDKNTISGRDWLDALKRDVEEKTQHAWTRIPDWVTETLAGLGYDGIKDIGGKYGGKGHGVWIPFRVDQVKSVFNRKFDPSERTFGLASRERSEQVERAMRERRVTERINTADHKGGAFSDELRNAVAGVEYAIQSDEGSKRRVGQYLAEHTLDEAVLWFMSNVTVNGSEKDWVVLGAALVRTLDRLGRTDDAQKAALRLAERGTAAGQAVQAFSLFGGTVDTPEKALVLHARETRHKVEAVKRATPAIEAAKEELRMLFTEEEVTRRLVQYIEQLNLFPRRANRVAARVEDLPEVTFSLTAEQRASGIVSAVARMLQESGPTETHRALLEKYGERIKPHLNSLLVEATNLAVKRKRGAGKGRGKAKSEAGAAAKEEAGRQPELSEEQIEETLAEARAMGRDGQQTTLADLDGLAESFEEELMRRLRARQVVVPRQVRAAVRDVLTTTKLDAQDFEKAFRRNFAKAFDIHALKPDEVKRLGELAENVRSTPENSQARMEAVIELNSYVMDRVQPYDMADVAFALWYSSVLSGIPTTFRNIIGNSSFLLMTVGQGFLLQNPRDWLRSWAQIVPAIRDAAGAATAQAGAALTRGRGESALTGDERGRKRVLESVQMRGPWRASKYVTRFLAAQDALFFTTAYELKARQVALQMAREEVRSGRLGEEQLAAEIERLLNRTTEQVASLQERAEREWGGLSAELQGKTTREKWVAERLTELQMRERNGELVARSVRAAERATFNYAPEGVLGVFMGMLESGFAAAERLTENAASPAWRRAGKIAAKFGKTQVIPFFRVPTNVFNQAMDYTPAGFARWVAYGQFGRWVTEGGRPRLEEVSLDERAETLNRATLGTAIGVLLALYAWPDDDGDEDGEKPAIQIHGAGSGNYNKDTAQNGPRWQPWSIEIRGTTGSTYISYKLLPLAPLLAGIGYLHDRARYRKGKDTDIGVMTMLQGWLASFLAQSPMTGLQEMFETATLDRPRKEESMRRVVARASAGMAANVAIPVANFWRSVDRMFLLDEKRQQDTARAAALAQLPFGEHANRPRLDALGDPVENRGFDWLFTSAEAGTPEGRIYAVFGEKNVQPSDTYHYKSEMEPEQFYRFAQARGQFIKDALLGNGERLLRTLQDADEEQAAKLMARINERATDYAKREVGYIPPSHREKE